MFLLCVRFIQDWVFHGTFRDIYSEFMIQMNMDYLEARGKMCVCFHPHLILYLCLLLT